jgi:ubiquinone/menaquinone biosynthesis C-methylase UbiE
MKVDGEVQNLFNGKAKTWSQKYEPRGRLAGRAATFLELVERFLSQNDRILDLGCGTGAISSRLAARGFRPTACDVAGEMIETGKKDYRNSGIEWFLLPSGWKRLPFGPNTFDGIIASSVLEYIIDLDTAFAECQRILKPGGYLIATVPNPRHLVRRLENLLRPVGIFVSQMPILNRLSRLRAYVSYLKFSRNRMPLSEWFDLGRQMGFSTLEQDKSHRSKGPLVFLVFRKSGDKSGEHSNVESQ